MLYKVVLPGGYDCYVHLRWLRLRTGGRVKFLRIPLPTD